MVITMTTLDTIPTSPLPPKRKPVDSPKKNNGGGTTPPPISQAEKYQLAYMEAWTKLPKWKQVSIEINKQIDVDNSRFMNDFLHEVIRLAEQS
jgi:hypothetical protein